MALPRFLLTSTPTPAEAALRILLIVAVVLVFAAIATVLFGWSAVGPGYEITPDPLGAVRY